MNTRAVVFDCDGVLIDSEDLAWEAWANALGRYGQSPTPTDRSLLLGRTVDDIYGHFRAQAFLPALEIFEKELDGDITRLFAERLRVFGDGIALVKEVRRRGLPLAVASSSDQQRLRMSLDTTALTDFFDVIVAGNEVPRGKPAPDVYLEAARRLGVQPEHCVAVEDSSIGVAAAAAAGMRVLVVVRTHTDRDRIDRADIIVDELSEAALNEVLALVSTESDSTN